MNIITEINDLLEIRKHFQNKSVGFVPTMGNLHEGHLSLCKKSMDENDITVLSVFINPTQFNNNEDLNNYPKTLSEDVEKLKNLQIDYIFAPNEHQLYPDKFEIQIIETHLSKTLEGEHRPGHFSGMLTIVMKLFNLIQPTRAYFGEKDYQQLLLVRKLVSSLFIPVEIIACETIRNKDGLALSSRNNKLTMEQLFVANKFSELLKSHLSDAEVEDQLKKLGFEVEYITKKWHRRLGAVRLGNTRLIDNIQLEV